jgi:hypothetical protein
MSEAKRRKEAEFKRKFRTYLLIWPAVNSLTKPKSVNFNIPLFVMYIGRFQISMNDLKKYEGEKKVLITFF